MNLVPVISMLREIGRKYEKAPAQVALRSLMENQNAVPIPGAKNAKQALNNVGALSFSLMKKEGEELGKLTIGWRN